MSPLKNKAQRLFIIISVIGLMIVALIFGVIHLLSQPLFPFIGDLSDKVSSTFESKHSDKDIMDYLQEEHGIKVKVLENAGEKNMKTADGGYAIVQAEDGTRFRVDINVFGAISGDTYLFEKGKPIMRQFIKSNEDTPYVLGDVFTDLTLKTDDEKSTYSLHLTIDDDVELVDDAFMEQFYAAYEIISRWNDRLEKSEGLSFKQLQVGYFGEKRDIEEIFYISLKNDFTSIEDFERSFANSNDKVIFHTYNTELFDYVESFQDQLPEELYFKKDIDQPFLECYALEAVDECSDIALHIGVFGGDNFGYYDNEEMREKLLEGVQVIQSIDAPIERLIVHGISLPDDLTYQDLDREALKDVDEVTGMLNASYEIENFKEVKRTEDLWFHKY